MSKKSKKTIEQPKQEEPIVKVKPKAKEKPKQEAIFQTVPEQPAVEPEPFDMQKEILSMKAIMLDLLAEVAILVASQRLLRRPTANGKVQILDKQTSKVYPSKNNAYQSLLKSGDLKELVDQGIFGLEPTRNTFGWYALQKALPDRFEIVQE